LYCGGSTTGFSNPGPKFYNPRQALWMIDARCLITADHVAKQSAPPTGNLKGGPEGFDTGTYWLYAEDKHCIAQGFAAATAVT